MFMPCITCRKCGNKSFKTQRRKGAFPNGLPLYDWVCKKCNNQIDSAVYYLMSKTAKTFERLNNLKFDLIKEDVFKEQIQPPIDAGGWRNLT